MLRKFTPKSVGVFMLNTRLRVEHCNIKCRNMQVKISKVWGVVWIVWCGTVWYSSVLQAYSITQQVRAYYSVVQCVIIQYYSSLQYNYILNPFVLPQFIILHHAVIILSLPICVEAAVQISVESCLMKPTVTHRHSPSLYSCTHPLTSDL